MKLVIIEPLGVEEDKLMEIAHKALPDSIEIISYKTKVTDTESLIERGKDADIIMVANLPLNADVIKGCKNLKMLAVAFTGIDHIAMDACKEPIPDPTLTPTRKGSDRKSTRLNSSHRSQSRMPSSA